MDKFNKENVTTKLEEVKIKLKNGEYNLNLGQKVNIDNLINFFKNVVINVKYEKHLMIVEFTDFKKELLIDFFIDEVKIKAKKKGYLSIYDFLKHDTLADDFLKDLISKNENIDGLLIRQEVYENKLARKYCREVSHFSIYISLSVYNKYKPRKILDPCMGWGERLIGALLFEAEEYLGIDPSAELFNKYVDICKTIIKKTGTETVVKIYKKPFEDMILEDEYFDMVFTSPPFYDQEVYNDDLNQSYIKYKTINEFNSCFISPLVYKSVRALKKGGYFILHYPLDFKLIDKILRKNGMTRAFPIFCTKSKGKINRFLTYTKTI